MLKIIDWIKTPQNLINTLTIFLLAWTTIETSRSRNSSNKTNEISLLPLLIVEFEGKFFTKGVKFYIKNLGDGVAYNVQINPVKCYFGDGKKWEKLGMKTVVKGTNAISKNQKVDLHILTYRDDVRDNFGGIGDFLMFMMVPSTDEAMKGGKINLIIEFTNAYSKKYFTIISTGSGGTDIVQPAIRSNWRNKLYWHARIKLSQMTIALKYFNKSQSSKVPFWKYPIEVLRRLPYWYMTDYTQPN